MYLSFLVLSYLVGLCASTVSSAVNRSPGLGASVLRAGFLPSSEVRNKDGSLLIPTRPASGERPNAIPLLTPTNSCNVAHSDAIEAAGELVVQYAQAARQAISCWDPKQYDRDVFTNFFRRQLHASTVSNAMELVLNRMKDSNNATKTQVFCMPQDTPQCVSGAETFTARQAVKQNREEYAVKPSSPYLYIIGLCPRVWDRLEEQPVQCRPASQQDTLAKKLFREMIHVVSEYHVGDVVSGVKSSQSLIEGRRPNRALRNADSYAYFAARAWQGGWNKPIEVEACLTRAFGK